MARKLLVYKKIEDLFWKYHRENGFFLPRGVIEANLARDFRLCREEISKLLDEMKLFEKIQISKLKEKQKKLHLKSRFKPIR